MKFFYFLGFFLALFSYALSQEPSNVIVLSGLADFQEKINNGPWLVEFYAPWCGHCKRLAPVWEDLATAAKDKFYVAKVDCTVEKEICTQNSIRGYPSIKFIQNGQTHDYSGQRTVEAFTTFVEEFLQNQPAKPLKKIEEKPVESKPVETKSETPKSETGESRVTILTDSNFEEQTKEGVWFIEFYAPWCGYCKKLAPIWEELATNVKDSSVKVAKIDCTIEKKTCTTFEVRGYPTLKLLKEGKPTDYKGPRTIESFVEFLKTNSPDSGL